MLILAPLGQATITERSLTLASAWVRQARYVTPQSQDVFVKLSGSCSPCSTHRIYSGGPALIGRQDCVPASSLRSSQRHQDSQPVFVVVFRRQIAHVAVSAALLQSEPPRLYGLHFTSKCRTRPDPIRLCMPRFAELSVSTSSFGSIPASTNSSRCRTSCSVQLCLPARESNDVLCRAAEFDGM